jgi:hypothetical protein
MYIWVRVSRIKQSIALLRFYVTKTPTPKCELVAFKGARQTGFDTSCLKHSFGVFDTFWRKKQQKARGEA